jgi:hypothetical protein
MSSNVLLLHADAAATHKNLADMHQAVVGGVGAARGSTTSAI